MATVISSAVSRRRWLAGLASAALAAALTRPAPAAAPAAKVGLIDLTLDPRTLARTPGIKLRHLSFWATGFAAAAKQSREHRRDHGEVMAGALIEAFRTLAPEAALELYVASPFVEDAEGRKLIDIDQLGFAFDWFAGQGVSVVALTFVGRASPALAAAIDRAAAHGLVVLASAGNGPGHNPVPAYPAAYPGVIAVGTTALAAERAAEDHRLLEVAAASDAPAARRAYVDYGVAAPLFTTLQLRRDPELASLLGSSRAVVVAAGVLAAAAEGRALAGLAEALALLDRLAETCAPDIAARGVIDLARLRAARGRRPPPAAAI
jgi:hypothetical protein